MTRATLETIQAPRSVPELLDMMTRGTFHSHQDGRWRYSDWKSDCVYCADPSPLFPVAYESQRAIPEHKVYLQVHHDNTRGIRVFNQDTITIWHIYGARTDKELHERAWLAQVMAGE